MASPKPLLEGQTPISCQLCEESSQIKWKCLQCDFLLCTKCQQLHEKVKSTYQHTIIDIQEIASHQAKDNKDFRNIPCEIHREQNCCLFCQTCDKVVCPSCIAKTHTKHILIELAEGYELTTKKIKTFKSELHTQIFNNKRGIHNLSSFKSSEDSKYEREKQKIMSRKKVLKDEVEMHTKKLLTELEQRWDHQTKSVNEVDNQSQMINKDLEVRVEILINALTSVNTCAVFRAYEEEQIARKQNKEPINTNLKGLPQYVPGTMHIQQALHGELTEPDDYYSLDHFKFKVMTKFRTGLTRVGMVFCCADGTLWISDLNDEILQKIQFSKGLVKVVHNKQIFCAGMDLLKSGDLLISTAKPNLKILSHTTGKIIKSKYSVAPLITGSVHITNTDKIIVRTRKEGPLFPINGQRQVVVMDRNGTTEKVYDRDNNGQSIFSAPQRITTDTDNNIYVLDSLKMDWSGIILALDKINGVRWIYSGNSDILKDQTFKPRDLLATKLNNIVVIDSYNHMIHILNTLGQCIHYMNTEDQLGIKSPYSLDIDNTGTLFIGCNAYQGEHKEDKIYTVQVSGF
ncbi:Hypothetical predicted protein [Mytilus galloprovincialis]|uniref:B box-type domain-containing protein n=1 Tax=Mytilus galloprovincialis TaxID=29158 RepID=A0A8B6FIP0_MYTGA|nr:Hypothetical predicted protein [Mytilus galloprovincialis]